MARKPQVTRTMTTTKVSVLCLNIEDAEPYNEVVTLPRTYKDEKAILKEVRKIIDTDTTKAVHVVATKIEETLYGMDEDEFIKYAKILPPRNTKNG